MSIVGGFDLHRQQITFDYVVRETGEVARGRIVPADRDRLRVWLARLGDQGGDVVVEGKLIRRVHHTLRELGDEAWEPVAA